MKTHPDINDTLQAEGVAGVLRRHDAAPKWRSAHKTSETSPEPLKFDPAPYVFPDPAKIPPRPWLFRRHYMRGVVSATLGAPGRLKSTNALTETIGMAAGRDLVLGTLLECGPLRAAYFNGEETQDELDRRVAAICQHYKLRPEQCMGRLWVKSTRSKPIHIATLGPKGNAVIDRVVVDGVTMWCETQSIDVITFDPLVSFHLVRENDPGDMDLLFKQGFGHIAGEERRAVELDIHPRKPAQGEINTSISDLRGSSAQEAALRIARVFNFMTTAEADQLGIEEDDRRLHVRIDGGKGGPAPIAKATWLKIKVETIPNGDEVAIASPWQPENPFTNVTTKDLETVRRAVLGCIQLEHGCGEVETDETQLEQTGAFRTDSRSPEWLGWWMAENLPHLKIKTRHGENPRSKAGKAEIAKLKQIIATWRKNGVLHIVTRKDETRRDREYFEAIPSPPTPVVCQPKEDVG